MADKPVVEFDHLGPVFAADTVETFDRLRSTCPVAWTDAHGGFWVPTRHRDVAEVSRNDALFSSARQPGKEGFSAITIPGPPSIPSIPIELDPPEFYAYRHMLNPLLSPARVDSEVSPVVQRLARYFVDCFIESGSCDFIADLTGPVPTVFTLSWLGLPLDRWKYFASIVHGITAFVPGTPDHDACVEGMFEMYGVYADTVAQRRTEPRDDVITYLTRQKIDGQLMSDQRIVEIVGLLVSGGVDTTTSLAGQALMWLGQHPDERRRLIDDPDLLPLATEEFLRVFCPVTSLARTVMADTTLAGQHLSAGERIMLPWLAANHDPEVFDDPNSVRLDRYPNRHTAFGLGVHRCIGSNSARSTFRAIVTEVLTRLPDYVVDSSTAHQYPAQGIVSGWSAVPATFTPGPKVGEPVPFPELQRSAQP